MTFLCSRCKKPLLRVERTEHADNFRSSCLLGIGYSLENVASDSAHIHANCKENKVNYIVKNNQEGDEETFTSKTLAEEYIEQRIRDDDWNVADIEVIAGHEVGVTVETKVTIED